MTSSGDGSAGSLRFWNMRCIYWSLCPTYPHCVYEVAQAETQGHQRRRLLTVPSGMPLVSFSASAPFLWKEQTEVSHLFSGAEATDI